MPKHFLVFLNGAWHRTNRLPVPKVAPPEAHQIKWLIRGWDEYIVCERNKLWRLPHTNSQGRGKGFKQILSIEKRDGYRSFNLWKDDKRCYYSVIQLRRLLIRNLASIRP
ncbi:hypothetical protein DDQ68_04560 [Hymenobacter nivis]|uniref:Uncharacterized protein n=1 Tax=Hymenobacter nivis TaxID=1850093 RepID=A0A2Z3GEL1_9BACT|nr:hypothetical protein DDQ68_04560 [Hymenobacter nivis]